MPHPNRVDPEGRLHAVPHRLAWYGNRGCLHDAAGHVRRAWQGTRWITCVLDFKGRRRTLLQHGRFTELFFLDEASAYAAGHRPCAECRRADWERFRDLWAARFGEDRAGPIDARLHAARLDGRVRRLCRWPADQVPAGAMIRDATGPVLRGVRGWWRWSFEGYAEVPEPVGPTSLLTPEPLVQLMAEGLPVQIHASAN